MANKIVHASDVKTSEWRWPSFSIKEIACKGDGLILIHSPSLDKLQLFRDMVNCPVILNSAFRSKEYNKQIGGAPKSQHLLGRAFDVRITEKLTREKIHLNAKLAGFTGFGDYDTFVHIDTGPARSWDKRT